MIRALLIVVVCALAGCNLGRLPNKELSKSNITDVQLSFTGSQGKSVVVHLTDIQLSKLSEILCKRKEEFVEPDNCYDLKIYLKDGGSVSYRTDGNKFQGYDDSSDRPFSFSVKENILTEVFKLKKIEHCK